MPFYDYICRECGKVFDRMISMEHRNEDHVLSAPSMQPDSLATVQKKAAAAGEGSNSAGCGY